MSTKCYTLGSQFYTSFKFADIIVSGCTVYLSELPLEDNRENIIAGLKYSWFYR